MATLDITGTSSNTVTIGSATDIYASNVSHANAWLDIHTQNVVIHGNYLANNAALALGPKKLTIDSGKTATFTGTLTVNATYSGDRSQIVLDFSNATSLTASAVTALTFNIDNNSMTPHVNDVITIIKAPSNIILPASATVSIGTSDSKWHVTSFGVLTYDPPAPAGSGAIPKPSRTFTGTGFAPLNATSENIASAASSLSSSGVTIKTDGTLATSTDANGYTALSLSDSVLANIATQTHENQIGTLAIIGETYLANPNLQPDVKLISAIFDIAHNQDLLPDSIKVQNMSPETAATLAETLATEGKAGSGELITRVNDAAHTTASAANVSVITFISSRIASTIIVPSGSGIGSFPAPSPTSTTPTNTPSVPAPSGNTNAAPSVAGSPVVAPNTAEEKFAIPGENLEAAAYGIAAGSTPYDKFGVWGSLNLGQASQKILNGNPGFKSFSKGASIGVDTMINERTVIGFNVSNSFSNIKYKSTPQGNKTDVSSWIGALYGNYQFRDNWFVRGTALFNKTHINNKSLRKIVGGYGVAQAKYNMISYGGDANIGFTHRFANQVILTPTLGIRLLHNNKISYGETGNTGLNISSSQKALTAYSSLAGISVAKSFIRSAIELTPEAHINAQYGINSKGPKGSFVSPLNTNGSTSFVGTSPSKLTTVYGVSFTGSTDRVECSLGGDMTISNKYVGYQGTMKLKVKF